MAVWIYSHNCPTQTMNSQFRVKGFWSVVTNIRELVSPLKTELVKSKGKIPYILIVSSPGDRLPDTKLLLPDGRLVVTIS